MISWFPDRRFIFIGDSGFGTHEMARFVHRHRVRLSLVSKLHPEANLFEPPPPYSGQERPPVKGPQRPKPNEAVTTASLQVETVAWYGGSQREVGVTTGTGHWYKSGEGLVPLVWVFVKDQTGTHRDEYFFSTDLTMTAVAMIGAYCGRWNLETTFQGMRSFLGLETTRGWCRQTVLRAGPVPVWSLYRGGPAVPELARIEACGACRMAREARRHLLRHHHLGTPLVVARWVFPWAGGDTALEQLPEPFYKALFYALAPAI